MPKKQKANVHHLAYVGSKPGASRDSDSWFTPSIYVSAARKVLDNKIGLDPFSSIEADEVVMAKKHFNVKDDAFTQDWKTPRNARTVWMNPPYSRGLIEHSVNKFIEEWLKKRFDRAIVLVNNSTDTRWWKKLMANSAAVCLTHHRISFITKDGKSVSGNTRGQAFFLFADGREIPPHYTIDKFASAFSQWGDILVVKQLGVTNK